MLASLLLVATLLQDTLHAAGRLGAQLQRLSAAAPAAMEYRVADGAVRDWASAAAAAAAEAEASG